MTAQQKVKAKYPDAEIGVFGEGKSGAGYRIFRRLPEPRRWYQYKFEFLSNGYHTEREVWDDAASRIEVSR